MTDLLLGALRLEMRPISTYLLLLLLLSISFQTIKRTCVCVSRMSSQTNSPRKAPKRGRKPNSSGPSDFCRIRASSFAIHLKISKVLNGVALANYNEHDTIIAKQRIFIL